MFDAKATGVLLASLVELVTAKDFCEGLSLSRSQFNLLVEDGILQPKLKDAATKQIWDPSEGRAFLDRLLAGATTLGAARLDWEHISKTAQRLMIKPSEIIQAIWDGRIKGFGKHLQFDGYQSVYVKYEEVAATLVRDEPVEMSIEAFSKAVGLAEPIQLKRLTQNGHTPSTAMRNPKTKALQRYFTNGDVEAFHEKFVTLRTLARSKGESWQRISVALKAKGVTRFSPEGTNYGNLFLKSEAEAAIQ